MEGRNVQVNLFQAGKTRRNYGYLERSNENVKHMIHMPAASEKDLGQYLSCFDHGTQFKYQIDPEYGYPYHNKYSVVVLPSASSSSSLQHKYGRNARSGPRWCHCEVVPRNKCISLNEVFPKVASLAGFRKDKAVKKGWITYQDRTLTILSGKSAKIAFHSKYLNGTAFEGENKHKPESEDNIICQMTVKVKSLHELFCIAEGLLESIIVSKQCLNESQESTGGGNKRRRTI